MENLRLVYNGMRTDAQGDSTLTPRQLRIRLASINSLQAAAELAFLQGHIQRRLPEELIHPVNGTEYIHPDFIFDIKHHRVTVGEKVNRLTPIEFQLLSCLAANPNTVATPEDFRTYAWPDSDLKYVQNLIKAHIFHLREKLGDIPDEQGHYKIIVTKQGFGYELVDQNLLAKVTE